MPANMTRSDQIDVLLMNAPGNKHTQAIRILALWLGSKGMRAQIADAHLPLDDLGTLVSRMQLRTLLVSMALAEQRSDVIALAERLAELPKLIRPRVIVGGYAVKLGLVPPIPGVELMADISLLSDTDSQSTVGSS